MGDQDGPEYADLVDVFHAGITSLYLLCYTCDTRIAPEINHASHSIT